MSSDLLKEFGDLTHNPWQQSQNISDQGAFEDDFGVFEEPPETRAEDFTGSTQILHDLNDVESDVSDTGQATSQTREGQSSGLKEIGASDWGEFELGDILFDADAEDLQKSQVATRVEKKANDSPLKVDSDDDGFNAWEPASALHGDPAVKTLQPQAAPNAASRDTIPPSASALDLGPPPSNVPPPSLLLSLGSNFISQLSQVNRQGSVVRELQCKEYVKQQSLSRTRAVGRILAGRKFRWKRDSILSQSMSIGEAGKQGGMKLTKVDKTESRREEQEASELIRLWRLHAGALRVSLACSGEAKLADLAEHMPVRGEKPEEGALTAPKPCFLCGLRRDERVAKLDVEVQDSFGEWWQEHWGHLDCVNFWEKHKGSLPQR